MANLGEKEETITTAKLGNLSVKFQISRSMGRGNHNGPQSLTSILSISGVSVAIELKTIILKSYFSSLSAKLIMPIYHIHIRYFDTQIMTCIIYF